MSTVASLSSLNNATLSNTTNSNSTKSALGALSSTDFMKLMIQQLSHQDPLNPTDSNQMLGQISQISTLQSNTQMTQSLAQVQTNIQSLTLQQSIGAGGNLIGKSVAGTDANGALVTGNVTAIQVQNQSVYLVLDKSTVMPMSNVEAVTIPSAIQSPVTAPATTPGT